MAMKGSRALLESWKFFIYLSAPVALVIYFSDPEKLREGLIKRKYITYQQEDTLENILRKDDNNSNTSQQQNN